MTYRDIETWFLDEAIREPDLLELFESFVWRLVAASSNLERASLHVGTLHPQLLGFAWNWNRADGFCDEVQVAAEALSSDAYRTNPLYRVVEHGESFRTNLGDQATREKYPLLAELHKSDGGSCKSIT
jgi:adenylate cyclase